MEYPAGGVISKREFYAALVATKPIANERAAKLRDIGDAFAKPATELHGEFVSLGGIIWPKNGVHLTKRFYHIKITLP